MTTYPHVIDNGAGEKLVFLRLTQHSGGERIEVEGFARPGAGPPMHVHYLQDEAAQVVSGRVGYQILGQEAKFAGPGESVMWPAGTPHKWWNAGDTELHMTGWCSPPDNVEFYLSSLFASMKRNDGKRPGLFDAAFLMTRYKSEFGMLEIPVPVRAVVIPLLYAVGKLLGKYHNFRDAPVAVTR